MTPVELFFLGSAFLLLLCVFASKVSGKLGFPTLVVFLGVGILAGSEGIGGIYFDNANAAQSLGVVALAYILFSGGLDTNWREVRPIIGPGSLLATLGVFATCIFIGLFNYYVLDFTWLESLLIGAIVSSTDAGAVFTVLRSKGIRLQGNLKPLLELESGSNDPMAVFLTTTVLSLMQTPESSPLNFISVFFSQMIMGLVMGYAGGRLSTIIFNKIKLEFDGLYTVMSLAVVLMIYTLTQGVHGNGFLAVYVAGVVLGNSKFVHKKSIILFHDGVSWLMQSSLFLVLGLLLFPSKVIEVTVSGVMLATFMMLVARPLSVFICLMFSKISLREQALISWVGLRGSVPVVMATYPLAAGIGHADLIFNLVFFVALSSLIFQGSFIPLVARLLKVEDTQTAPVIPAQEDTTTVDPRGAMEHILIPEESELVGKSIVDLKTPEDLLIVLIEREGKKIIPRGATQIMGNDKLHVLANASAFEEFKQTIS